MDSTDACSQRNNVTIFNPLRDSKNLFLEYVFQMQLFNHLSEFPWFNYIYYIYGYIIFSMFF